MSAQRDAEHENWHGDGEALLPDQTRDDTDAGWAERSDTNDERLWLDRPPHWD